ncbi:hypothetical protein Plhal304r1_c080g0166221 [Plasmopara halstedii]
MKRAILRRSTDSNSDGGEAVENEMKRLRVTYNYDGAHGVRWAGEATSVDTSSKLCVLECTWQLC